MYYCEMTIQRHASKVCNALASCMLLLFYTELAGAENKCYTLKNTTGRAARVDFRYPNDRTPVNGVAWISFNPGAQQQYCYEGATGATAIIGINSGFMWQGIAPTAAGYWLPMGGIPFAATPGTYNIVAAPLK
jgi:hypothetical protein